METKMENKKKNRAKYIIPFVIEYVIVAILMIKTDTSWGNGTYDDVKLEEIPTRVSVEEYSKLRIGMTYDEVCEIVGGEGALYTQFGNSRSGLTYYIWPGEFHDKNKMNSEVTVAFGRGSGLAEIIQEENLIDGEVVHQNILTNKKAVVKKDYLEIKPLIKQGMSYKQIVKIIGSEGVMKNSESKIDIDSGKTSMKYYEWYCIYDEEASGDIMRIWFNADNKAARF